MPGDFVDLQTLYLACSRPYDHQHRQLACGFHPHSDLKDLLAASPNLAGILWRETIIEATTLREWLCNVGARDALAGVAHPICEIASRLSVVGLVADGSFHLPLTQQDIASACGISAVHANRTLQELRKGGLIRWSNRKMTLPDWEELKRVAQFEPDYLHGQS